MIFQSFEHIDISHANNDFISPFEPNHHYSDVTWAPWHLRSSKRRLFVHTSTNERSNSASLVHRVGNPPMTNGFPHTEPGTWKKFSLLWWHHTIVLRKIVQDNMCQCLANGIKHLYRAWWRHQMETFSTLLDLWEESTGHRWILLTMASDAEHWLFLWYMRLNKWLSIQSRRRWFVLLPHWLWSVEKYIQITQSWYILLTKYDRYWRKAPVNIYARFKFIDLID